jgi:hypothetical protein
VNRTLSGERAKNKKRAAKTALDVKTVFFLVRWSKLFRGRKEEQYSSNLSPSREGQNQLAPHPEGVKKLMRGLAENL